MELRISGKGHFSTISRRWSELLRYISNTFDENPNTDKWWRECGSLIRDISNLQYFDVRARCGLMILLWASSRVFKHWLKPRIWFYDSQASSDIVFFWPSRGGAGIFFFFFKKVFFFFFPPPPLFFLKKKKWKAPKKISFFWLKEKKGRPRPAHPCRNGVFYRSNRRKWMRSLC